MILAPLFSGHERRRSTKGKKCTVFPLFLSFFFIYILWKPAQFLPFQSLRFMRSLSHDWGIRKEKNLKQGENEREGESREEEEEGDSTVGLPSFSTVLLHLWALAQGSPKGPSKYPEKKEEIRKGLPRLLQYHHAKSMSYTSVYSWFQIIWWEHIRLSS